MNFLLTHAPILIIALPLLGAFLTPLISRIHPKIRNVFVLVILILTGFLTMLLTRDVLSNGIRVYVLGAASSTLTTPTGYIMPVRIILE
ncbi:MAG: NADH:ubiquinone oxidoreductase, partial [Candidatus Thermoplasmatota archaeon]|nr:NADH:ubiquinone oxidoreductase [Candidatus Thermoplasmatota archaeon]